jgi:hypothetical protein
MNKTSYNNFYGFLPFINSTRNNTNNKLAALTPKLDLSEQVSTPNNSLLNNQIFYNDMKNFNKIQVIKKINLLRNKQLRNDIFSTFRRNNKEFIKNKNIDINNINRNFSSSLLNINKVPDNDKNKTFYLNNLNKDNSMLLNSSLEKNNIMNTSKNTLILDLNRSDSFKKYNSSYLFEALLNKISSQSRNYNTNYNTKTKLKPFKNTVFKPSKFYKKSKNEKITAHQIYRHYLKREQKKPKNKRHIFNGSYDYSYVMCPSLKLLYGENPSFVKNIYEIKKNDNIAFKKDFDIKEYQNTLMKLFRKNISEKNMDKLRNDYKLFNEKNFGFNIPKGRYIDLAMKLKDNISNFAFENIKRMDRNYEKYFGEEKVEDKEKQKQKKDNKNKNKKMNKKNNKDKENNKSDDEDDSNKKIKNIYRNKKYKFMIKKLKFKPTK